MAVNVNDGTQFGAGGPRDQDQVNLNREEHTNFTQTELGGNGPVGRLDFRSLTRRIGVSRIDASVEPYLDKVLEIVKTNLPNVTRVQLERLTNAFAFRFEATDGTISFFGIQFVTGRDPVGQNFVPKSQLLRNIQQELREREERSDSVRIVDARIIVSGFAGDMNRTAEMANTIVATFQMATVNELKNAQISAIAGTEFVTNWNPAEAKQLENALSPHGIRPRVEVAMTLMAKLKSVYGSNDPSTMDQEFEALGMIGGYTELRERERFVGPNGVVEIRYQPIFHIAALSSVIPHPGIAAILIRAFAPAVFSSLTWARQWRALSDNDPHPGLLEADPDQRDRPVQFRDAEELRSFIETKCATPYIAYDYLDGYDNIPGMVRMVQENSQSRQRFMQTVAQFFGASTDNLPRTEVTQVVDFRFEGGVGDVTGSLTDSRGVDYLYLAAKNGVSSLSGENRLALMGNVKNPVDRAKIVSAASNGNFVPLYLNSVAVIDATFLNWVGEQCVQNNLRIVDPEQRPESRPLGSFLGGFGSNANMSSIVASGIGGNRGLNLGSVWNYTN